MSATESAHRIKTTGLHKLVEINYHVIAVDQDTSPFLSFHGHDHHPLNVGQIRALLANRCCLSPTSLSHITDLRPRSISYSVGEWVHSIVVVCGSIVTINTQSNCAFPNTANQLGKQNSSKFVLLRNLSALHNILMWCG